MKAAHTRERHVYLATEVDEWVRQQAERQFVSPSRYIADLLTKLYRRSTGGENDSGSSHG